MECNVVGGIWSICAAPPGRSASRAFSKISRQRPDIVLPFPQWRNGNGKYIQSEKQVGSELSLPLFLREALTGSRDNAHIGFL